MNFFNKFKKKEELILVLDIGSSSMGGALFYSEKNQIPKIVFSIREPIILEKEINTDRFFLLALKSLENILNKIQKTKFGSPNKIFCVLSSVWHISQTRIITYSKNTPFVFNSKLADELTKKEINLFESEHLKEYSNDNKIRLIEFKNIKIMLNGYEVLQPLNQTINTLEMFLFVSLSGEKLLENIEKIIKNIFPFQSIQFSSSLLASFMTMREIFSNEENFLLIDVGGELTNISMIKNNILKKSVSFPLGFNFMIREISSNLNLSLTESKSMISLLKDEHATKEIQDKIGSFFDKLKKEWLSKFQESLANFSNDISIPSNIYLTIDKDLMELFSKIIESEQFNQYTLTESKFKITFLNTDIFNNMISFDKDVILDPSLILNTIYINHFLN